MKLAITIVFVVVVLFGTAVVQPVRASGGEWYIVQQGDTLASIASSHRIPVDELLAANNLSWDAWISAGQPLVIPGQLTLPDVPPGPPPRSPWPTGFVEPVQVLVYGGPDTTGYSGRASGFTSPPPQATDAFPRQHVQWSSWTGVEANPYPGSVVSPQSYQVDNTPSQAPLFTPAQPTSSRLASTPGPERWIDVDLTGQTLTAYEGQEPVFNATVSTGTWQYPTVVGTFAIYVKFDKARMRGGSGVDAYDLPDVPYVMYFHKDYGLHGTYWHDKFGTPMSHGCVNLSMVDSEWLFNWASVGTKVVTHY